MLEHHLSASVGPHEEIKSEFKVGIALESIKQKNQQVKQDTPITMSLGKLRRESP